MNRFTRRVCLLSAVFSTALSLTPRLDAQGDATRRLRVVPAPVGPSGAAQELYTRSHALLVGLSQYDHPGAWAPLPSVGRELADLKSVLERVGFDSVEQVTNPTGAELRQTVGAFINRYGYDPGARLVFYFSGHGHTLDGRGYFVPRDAVDPAKDEPGFRRTAISMDQIATWARDMTARHALFAFDSCFSGTIFRSRNRPVPQPISELTARKVRLFFAAGDAGETVPAQSVFTPFFTRALRGDADRNRDGFITGTELANWVQGEVLGYGVRQTPQFGKLRDVEFDEGDVVFVVPPSAPVVTPPSPPPPPAPAPPPSKPAFDPSEAQRQCDAGAAAQCYALGNRYQFGDGVAKDVVRARSLFVAACERGSARGCTSLGIMLDNGIGGPADLPDALGKFRLGCTDDDLYGCLHLGGMYLNGRGGRQDQKLAASLFKHACDQGLAMACGSLGSLQRDGVGTPRDLKEAFRSFQRSCDGGDMMGCRDLAFAYESGEGVAKDTARAITLFRTACAENDEVACKALTRLGVK